MLTNEQLALLQESGIWPDSRVKDFITDNVKKQLALDAALLTDPNSAVPAILTTFLDPTVIEILTAPRNARLIFPEGKKGDWTVPFSQFRVNEITGRTEPYSDGGNGGAADINVNFPTREQYIFQTTISYGEREMAVAGRANIQLVSEKQRAAATVIDTDSNKFYCLGVAGKEIYGLLNDPNLPPSTALAAPWAGKDTLDIYGDILALMGSLFERSKGLINQNSDLVLAVAPEAMVSLATPNEYGITAQQLLKNYAPNCAVVSLPELHNAATGNMIYLAAKSVLGVPTAHLAYSDKMRFMQVISKNSSSWEQKAYGTTYGAIIYHPFAIATATGA